MENIVKKKTAKQLFVVSAVMLATCGSFYGMNFEEGSKNPVKNPENENIVKNNNIEIEDGEKKLKKIYIDPQKGSICAMCCCCGSCDENKVSSPQSSVKREPINIKLSYRESEKE